MPGKYRFSRFWQRLVWPLLAAALTGAVGAASGTLGMVATVDELATEAGSQALRRGGNAVDAAVACGLTLGVVNGYNSGIGGGCLMLLRLADGAFAAIDGRETAPQAATRDMYVREGKALAELSQVGPLAVGVPGALAAYEYAASRYGKLPFRSHLLVAATLAEKGFRLDRAYAERIKETALEIRRFEATRALLLHPDGSRCQAGELFAQKDLAGTYRAIARDGVGWFYQGPFAQRTGAWMREHGGILTAQDFARYRVKLREPLVGTYRGHTIIGFPPPSSGGIHVLEALNVLEHFDLRAHGPRSPDFIHLVAETLKLVFADRAYWLGDADFVPVPAGLVSKSYAAELSRQIKLEHTTPVFAHGHPDRLPAPPQQHTTHFSTADAQGNWVACTATINTTFGSKIVVPGTGVFLNNQMDDFSAQPGATNYFGLVGAEANAITPGKRPLSSMSPTLVLRDGQPVLAVGAAGGPTIISQVLLALIYTMDFDRDIHRALAAPRFHHQWRPDELVMEERFDLEVIRDLQRRGHHVRLVKTLGAAQAVARAAANAALEGAADPRVPGGSARESRR